AGTPAAKPPNARAFAKHFIRTPFVTASPRTCWSPAPTCGVDQPASGYGAKDFGSVTSPGHRHHPRRVANPQNQGSKNSIGAVARNRLDRTGKLFDPPIGS